MARFTKAVLAAGTYHKGGDTIRVTSNDLATALDSHKKITGRGYKIPVIMEHSKTNDADGLPFKSKSEQLNARDLAKYQEGWSDSLRLNEFGELEADIDVRGADGLKLIREVGTFISPQFGSWRDPETGDVLPMAITHLALTPFPVDIGQNPEFREIPDISTTATTTIEASQLSHLVSFSMLDLVDFGQKSFNWGSDDESKHPRAEDGKFTSGGSGGSGSGGSHGGSNKPVDDDEPFTLTRGKEKKFVPKKQGGIQTDLFSKTKTTVSPADAHVKPQVESLPGQKTIGEKPIGDDEDPTDAAILKHLESGGRDIHELSKHTGIKVGAGHDPLKSKLNQSLARLVKAGKIEAKSAWSGSNNYTFHLPERKPAQMSHFDADAAVRSKLAEVSRKEKAEAAVRATLHQMSLLDSDSDSPLQMSSSMPFPPDRGDTDEDDDGIPNSQDSDFGDDGDDGDDFGAPPPAPPPAPTPDESVQDHLPADDNDGDPETWAQIGAALKMIGVIVPDATNAHALLAGLLTCAHHSQKAEQKEFTDSQSQMPIDPANPANPANPQQPNPAGGQDPRLKGTRQEQAFTMSQQTANKNSKGTPGRVISLEEFTQLSHTNAKMADQLTKLEREKYVGRINALFSSGRLSKPRCDSMLEMVKTYQFSAMSTPPEIAKLDTMIEMAEELPAGAVWSGAERQVAMSVRTEQNPGFFDNSGTAPAAPEDEDAEIERRFGK